MLLLVTHKRRRAAEATVKVAITVGVTQLVRLPTVVRCSIVASCAMLLAGDMVSPLVSNRRRWLHLHSPLWNAAAAAAAAA